MVADQAGSTDGLSQLLCLSAVLLLKNLTAWHAVSSRRRRNRCHGNTAATMVGRVGRIVLYPVKSCRGIELPLADLVDDGAGIASPDGVLDRSYLVLSEPDGGRFVSLKAFPRLSAVQPLLDPDRPGAIRLSAAGHPTIPVASTGRRIRVAFRTEVLAGLDCGDEAAEWLGRVCGGRAGLRLVRCPQGERSAARQRMRQLLDGEGVGGSGLGAYADVDHVPDNRVAYVDTSPILLVSDRSMQALNERLSESGQRPVDWRSFRPNLVVAGVDRAHAEDAWRFVRVSGTAGPPGGGAPLLSVVFQCERCAMVNLDYSAPDGTAATPPGNPVLGALAAYRTRRPTFSGPLFGASCAVEAPGRVAVGDPVFAW